MKDLGKKYSSSEGAVPAPPSGDKEHVSYPSFQIDGDQVKGTGLDKKTFGEVIEAKVKLKVTRIGGYGDDSKPSIGLDVIGIDCGHKEEKDDTEKKVGVKLPASKKAQVSPKEAGL